MRSGSRRSSEERPLSGEFRDRELYREGDDQMASGGISLPSMSSNLDYDGNGPPTPVMMRPPSKAGAERSYVDDGVVRNTPLEKEQYTVLDKPQEDNSPIPEVALTVPVGDDPDLPSMTVRMWVIGLITCGALAFVNQYFWFRRSSIVINPIAAQILTLFVGRWMAKHIPRWRLKLWGSWVLDTNPGPFSIKEHVLCTIFAFTGSAMGNGTAYSIDIISVAKIFYKRKVSFVQGIVLVSTTQMMGYGWAGLLRKFLVEPAHMWWPTNLVNVALFRALHERDVPKRGQLSRFQFFMIVSVISFVWYSVPNYFIGVVAYVSWFCWAWPKSVTANQLGSAYDGLGVLTFSFDWATIAAFLQSPLATPWFAIINIYVGFALVVYVILPILYWGDVYNSKTFPIVASGLFLPDGQDYDTSMIITEDLRLNETAFNEYGSPHMSGLYAVTYGIMFATLTATLSHVALYHGRDVWKRANMAAGEEKPDVHTKIMRRNYPEVPEWWFVILLGICIAAAVAMVVRWHDVFQLPWWGVLCAAGLSFFLTLPVGIITATTNQTPPVNVIVEMIWGYYVPGQPIGNILFKTYGYVSTMQALSFLSDFKLGHYMKIPPRQMFLAQMMGTLLAGMTNLGVATWLLEHIPNVCEPSPENFVWTCPTTQVFYSASQIWGLIGPARFFGPNSTYWSLNWFFLGGAIAPLPFYFLGLAFPKQNWIKRINMPLLIGATAILPPAGPVNYNTWFIVGMIFNYYIFNHRRAWWQRYNYILSAAMDTGVAFMAVLIFITLGRKGIHIEWWAYGINSMDNCDLARCPAAKGVNSTNPLCPYVPA